MIRDGEIETLINSGHQCIEIMETSPIQYIWCKEKYCSYNYSPKNLFFKMVDKLITKFSVSSSP